MLDKIDASFSFQKEAIRLREQRQEILASNIANADTPGYRARDIDFSSELKKAIVSGRAQKASLTLTTTSSNHLHGKSIFPANSGLNLQYRIPDQPSADGNTVDMDRERVNFADNSLKHQADINFVTSRIRSMLAVMQQ